jgi:four helix bundle protein
MQNYHQLSVWRKAHAIALNVHRLTERIPREGNSGLVGQLRRAALSIPSNIAEGATRGSDKDFIKFLQIALASAAEVEYQLEFAADASLIPHGEFRIRQQELTEIRKMLTGLIKRIRQGPSVTSPLSNS